MNPEELNRFLASVRKTRFVDYLDPMGETAHEALERRLKWAARSRNDPAHADEAEFLLRHAAALRQHLSQEQLEGDDDWIESAEAGSEWGGGAFRGRTPAPSGRATPGPSDRAAVGRAASGRATPGPSDRAASGRAASGRATPGPSDRAAAGRAASGRATPGPTDRAAPRASSPAASDPRLGARSSAAARPASPAGRPASGGRAPEPTPPRTGIMRIEDLTDPPAAPRLRATTSAGPTPPAGPSAASAKRTRPAPAPKPAEEPLGTELPDELIQSLSSRRVQSPSYTPAPAERSGLEEHEWVDPAGHTPAPSVARSAPSPVPARQRVDSPAPLPGSPRRALDIRASRSGHAVERERATRPERGPSPKLIFTAVAVAGFVAVAAAVTGAFGPAPEEEYEERVVYREPVEEVEPEVVEAEDDAADDSDEDALASLEEHPDDLAGDAVAAVADPVVTDAPAPEVVAQRSEPAREAPKPAPEPVRRVEEKPDPAPEVAKKADPPPKPKPQPKPEPPPETKPRGVDHVVEPPPAVTYPSLTGMWIGLAGTKSFQLEVDSQSGGSFSGVAQVMNDAGGWDQIRILGNVEPDGSLRFSQMGGGASFSGKIDGIRASGSVKLTPNAEPAKWSVIK